MKMTYMKHIPEYCDNCIYYGCKPHPYKGWSDICELCGQCMDDDQAEDWIYDGNGRPKNCPLMEVDESQVESEYETSYTPTEVRNILIEEGQGHGTKYGFKLGDTIKFSPTEVERILKTESEDKE